MPGPPLLKGIDRVMIEVPQPRQAVEFFSGILGLPLAWPLRHYSQYTSAGIAFGNTNLEFILFEGLRFGRPAVRDRNRYTFGGIAFSTLFDIPELESVLIKRGLDSRVGERAEGHILLVVEHLMHAYETPFICKYLFDTLPWQTYLNESFMQSKGGLLGITGITAIVVELHNLDLKLERWAHLGWPDLPQTRSIVFRTGPVINFRPGHKDRIARIDIGVVSLDHAIQSLLRLNLPDRIQVEYTTLLYYGLPFRLVEQAPL